MLNDSIGTITERIANNYGKDELRLLREWKFTAADINKLDGDRYAFLVATRPHDVDIALLTPADAERAKARRVHREYKELYADVRAGKISYAEGNKFIEQKFSQHFEAFKNAYPQVAGDEAIWATFPNGNAHILFLETINRDAPPTFAELEKSYGLAMVPHGSFPKLTILCPDSEYRTGKSLADAIRMWPMELLEPQTDSARPAHEGMSAAEFLANSPELRDDRQPALLKERFTREWRNFLAGDVGRALKVRADQHGLGTFLAGWMWEHMIKNQIPFHQKGFEQAALAVAAKVTIHTDDDAAPLVLAHEDIGGARTSNTMIHDGGGSHHTQHSLGTTMAGQIKPDAAEDTHVYSEAETRRLVRKLGSAEYRQLLNDSPNFRAAVDKYLGGA